MCKFLPFSRPQHPFTLFTFHRSFYVAFVFHALPEVLPILAGLPRSIYIFSHEISQLAEFLFSHSTQPSESMQTLTFLRSSVFWFLPISLSLSQMFNLSRTTIRSSVRSPWNPLGPSSPVRPWSSSSTNADPSFNRFNLTAADVAPTEHPLCQLCPALTLAGERWLAWLNERKVVVIVSKKNFLNGGRSHCRNGEPKINTCSATVCYSKNDLPPPLLLQQLLSGERSQKVANTFHFCLSHWSQTLLFRIWLWDHLRSTNRFPIDQKSEMIMTMTFLSVFFFHSKCSALLKSGLLIIIDIFIAFFKVTGVLRLL